MGKGGFEMKQNKLFQKGERALKNAEKRLNNKAFTAGVILMTFFLVNISPVFATGNGNGLYQGVGGGDTFFDSLGNAFNSAYLALVALAPVVAGLAFVIAKIWQMLTPEKQGRAEPREWARNALFNYFLVVAAAGIIGFIGRLAGAF